MGNRGYLAVAQGMLNPCAMQRGIYALNGEQRVLLVATVTVVSGKRLGRGRRRGAKRVMGRARYEATAWALGGWVAGRLPHKVRWEDQGARARIDG